MNLPKEPAINLTANQGQTARETFLGFAAPKFTDAEIAEVVDTLKSGWLTTGPKTAKFEAMFRDYIGSRHALALNSCTAGLHLSLVVTGIGPGDEVITSPMTFAATANSIIHAGAKPVFVDIDPDTMNIDSNQIEAAVSERTKAVIPVHFGGRPCDMGPIMKVAAAFDLTVIEDAAHAIEAEHSGQKIGNIGDLTSFSFYVTKNLVTGEGGMLTTNNDEWAEKIQLYSLHGLTKGAWRRYRDDPLKPYEVTYPGFKYNMMDIQAALGIHQLANLEDRLRRREEIWRTYDEAFGSLPLTLPAPMAAGSKHARHLYTILVDIEKTGLSRDGFRQALLDQNIGTSVHFTALHLHDYYVRTFGWRRGDFPNAELISDQTVSLPLSANLSQQDVEDVINAVVKVLR